MSQAWVNRTALDIAAGRADVVLIGGAEAWRTRMSFRSSDSRPDWTLQDESVPEAEVFGEPFDMIHPAELARGVVMPVQVYPIFEQALRMPPGAPSTTTWFASPSCGPGSVRWPRTIRTRGSSGSTPPKRSAPPGPTTGGSVSRTRS